MQAMAKEWRTRARHVRTQAALIQDPTAKAAMLNVAAIYEEVAARAQARADRAEKMQRYQLGLQPTG